MSGIDGAAIAVGTAVAKAACEVWLGDHRFGSLLGGDAIDAVSRKLSGARAERQFRRVWDQTADLVAERLEPLVEREYADLPESERIAALDAVRDTLSGAMLAEADLFALDLDASYLDRHLRSQDPDRVRRAGLSEGSGSLYELLMRECCACTIEVARALPQAGINGVTELLRRERHILDDLRVVLARLPVRRGASDFERDYLQLVANRLDYVELFGATLSEASRRYPLSASYLHLTVSGRFDLQRMDSPAASGQLSLTSTALAARVDDVLACSPRLFIRGQAGLGKTTLLQWVAVQSARHSFTGSLSDWNGVVPFFVPMRRYATSDLPAPEVFLAEAGRHIAEEMPDGWVHAALREGRAVVLVDGIDELQRERRAEARQWLSDLVSVFPRARFIVTSRPAAASEDWLAGMDFTVAQIQPMAPDQVEAFVRRWHQAVQDQCLHAEEKEILAEYEAALLTALASRGHLRRLAVNPLLCALLCALHRDRRGQLPTTRMELYEIALHMMLDRRDSERRILAVAQLDRTSSTLILRDLAYWLLRNGWSSVPSGRVQDRISVKLEAMPHVQGSAADIYRLLLERTGLLREQSDGECDFVHRSFQEYLAAAEAVANDDIGLLITNADRDHWSDVVVMAAGHASVLGRARLLQGLLERAEAVGESGTSDAFKLQTLACLEISPEIPPALRARIEHIALELLPPRTMAGASALARFAGAFVLDLLADCRPESVPETAATVRAIVETSDSAVIPLLARFGPDRRKAVVQELVRGWTRFDANDYARAVLSRSPLKNGYLEVADPRLLVGLHHLDHLRRLYCAYSESEDGLGFLSRVPQLSTLVTQDQTIESLRPVTESNLTSLSMNSYARDPDPLSLTPLATANSLESLMIWSRPVCDAGSLTRLRRLRRLRLDWLGSLEELAELAPLSHLEGLGIGNINDLVDLSHLQFLIAPRMIGINKCPVDDLGYLDRWADTITEVSLREMDSLDLGPLASLKNLEFLDIQSSTVRNLSALASLGNLKRIWMSQDTADISELAGITSLREVGFSPKANRDEYLDLAPLAGMNGLVVYAWQGIKVRNASGLGAGVKVKRSG